jgi:hypothetical protein
MLLAVEWGRVGECEQEGKAAQAKKGEEDLPQGAGAPRQGGLQQNQEVFLVKLLRSCHLGVI